MSDRDLLEIRVRLTRLASELAMARSERDLDRIQAEVTRVRTSLDDLLLMLPAARPSGGVPSSVRHGADRVEPGTSATQRGVPCPTSTTRSRTRRTSA